MLPGFILYPRAQQLLWTLARVLRRQHDKPHLVVTSPPNNGLTTVLREFVAHECARMPATEEVTAHPVIYTPAPPEFDEERLLNVILLSIGAPIATRRRNAAPLRRQTLTVLKNIGARMLVIDHAGHLWPQTPRDNRGPVDTVLEIAGATSTAVVIAGLRPPTLVDAAGPFAVAALPLWTEDEEYDEVVERFCSAHRLTIAPERRAQTIAALHAATKGRLGELSALLQLYAETAGPIVSELGLAALHWTPPGTPRKLPPL